MQTTAERSALVIVLVLQFSGSFFLVSILLYFFYFFEFSHFFLRAVVLLLLLCVGDSAAALIAACALQINIGEQRKRCSWLCTLKTGRRRKKHTHKTKQQNHKMQLGKAVPSKPRNKRDRGRSIVRSPKKEPSCAKQVITYSRIQSGCCMGSSTSSSTSSTRGFLPGLPLFWVPRLCPIVT